MCAFISNLFSRAGLAQGEAASRLRGEVEGLRRELDTLASRVERLLEGAYQHAPVIRIHQGAPPVWH